MSLVAPRLYLGDELAAASLPALLDAGVTHVLNCTATPTTAEVLDAAPRGILCKQLGLRDNHSDAPRMQAALEDGVEFIASAIDCGGTVLVHCRAGISRSPTLVLAYLARASQTRVDVLMERMRTKRSGIDPNLTYIFALQEWERRVLPPHLLRGRTSALGASTPPPPELASATSSPRLRPLSRVG